MTTLNAISERGERPGRHAPDAFPLIDALISRRARRFALHIDTSFHDRFYREGAYTANHAGHFAAWHPGDTA